MPGRISIEPSHTIGIIGGGQLGKMMTVAAKQMGFEVVILDPTPGSPAGQVADNQVVAEFDDTEAIRLLAEKVSVLTYEFEHIDSQILISLENEGYKIYPTPRSLQIIQNKLLQKEALVKAGILVPPFKSVSTKEELKAAGQELGFPLILKSLFGGYDGKGNWKADNLQEAEVIYAELDSPELMVEQFVHFEKEISIIIARGINGEVRVYPLSENEHMDHILHRCVVPARVSEEVMEKASDAAGKVMSVFTGVGIFCVEMFLNRGNSILVNEVAPRPHNSGHYTIEACSVSQFEQHVRAITGLPLGDTTLINPAIMVNLLGEEDFRGPAVLIGVDKALSLPGLHLHFYGKKKTAPFRKMGHFTVVNQDLNMALDFADKAEEYLKVISREAD
ncbi:MAG TPA: 5-(carboxyamino)imidazole ribonucleotide synthase [Candidatus Limnocylindrales bacterium]|nr:5-(carboxyamino)imidazole ribonucleotide synthase [Candidatus Limnocylindrales bacterium]